MMDYPSLATLLVRPKRDGNFVSSATGFVVNHSDRRWLVTNWHVVAGIDPFTLATLGTSPDVVHVGFRRLAAPQAAVSEPTFADVSLYDDQGEPRWLEHPEYGHRVDVVAVPLEGELDRLVGTGFELGESHPDVFVGCGRPLSIVGFPFGLSGNHLSAVWIQGWVATEPDEDFDDLPQFLVDARSRTGQSGSPVLYYDAFGEVVNSQGERVRHPEAFQALLGVYSGRINAESDLGIVWKRRALLDIVTRGIRPGESRGS